MKVIPIKRLEKSYSQELNEICDSIFKWSLDLGWSWVELAANAGVAPSTVWKLGSRHTKLPRYKTVFLLARAVGARMVLLEPRSTALMKAKQA